MSGLSTSASGASPVLGSGAFRYRVQPHWGQLPPGWSFYEVVGMALDSIGRVFAFNRGEHPVIVFDRQGKFLRSWGEGVFARPHGITIGPDDSVWCVDDLGHIVRKFTPEGQLLLTIGTGKASPTDAQGFDYRTIQQVAGPFNCPTNLALAPGATFTSPTATATPGYTAFRPRGSCASRGARSAPGRGSFTCHTALPWTPTAWCGWPIARIAACSALRPRDGSSTSGPIWRGRAR